MGQAVEWVVVVCALWCGQQPQQQQDAGHCTQPRGQDNTQAEGLRTGSLPRLLRGVDLCCLWRWQHQQASQRGSAPCLALFKANSWSAVALCSGDSSSSRVLRAV
jgi:hypothetical protein